MDIHKMLAVCCCCLAIGVQANAQEAKKNAKKPAMQAHAHGARLEKQASELMADRVSPTKVASDELALEKLASHNEQLSLETTMFPADELYNSNWDTLHVNPFARVDINYPESYTINCSTFTMPLDNNIKITSKYGPRRRRMHRGIDLKLQKGDTVRTAFDGKVRIKSYERRGYGYYLVIRHPNGLETVYGHLSKFLVRENQIVKSGQPIALGGNTGRSTGSHLHFETRFLGKDIDPAEIIDFANGVPYKDEYVFHNVKINGKRSNIYTSSSDAIAIHRVKKGETLSRIARKYGTTVSELCRLNGIKKTSKLSIGQAIRFKAKQTPAETAPNPAKQKTAAQPAQSAKAKSKSQPTAAAAAPNKKIEVPIAETVAQQESGPVYYRIQSGDTLFSIAKRYGLSVEKLCEMNNIKENTIIRSGQKIRCS